jgi:hypothetical protein
MAKALDEMGIPTTLVLDSGVAYALDRWEVGGGRGLWLMGSRPSGLAAQHTGAGQDDDAIEKHSCWVP